MVRVRAPSIPDEYEEGGYLHSYRSSSSIIGMKSYQIHEEQEKYTKKYDQGYNAVFQLLSCCESNALNHPKEIFSYKVDSRSTGTPFSTNSTTNNTIQQKDLTQQREARNDLEKMAKERDNLLLKIHQSVKEMEKAIEIAIRAKAEENARAEKKNDEEEKLEAAEWDEEVQEVENEEAQVQPNASTPNPSKFTKNPPVQQARQNNVEKNSPVDETSKKPQEASNVQDLKFVDDAKARIARLEKVQATASLISESTDMSVKKIRLNVKKMLGEACNQIANTDASIKTVVEKLSKVLTDARNAGDEYFQYSLDLTASKFVAQTRVITEIRSCYPLARVITICCLNFPELTDIFLGYMNKICPYTIPIVPEKKRDQSTEEYMVSIGMEYEEGSKTFESRDKYAQRMGMTVSLMAAVMQTMPSNGLTQPTNLSIADCWTWTARMVNADTHVLTCPLLLAVLETAGYQMLKTYRKQFVKLMKLIQDDLIPHLSHNISNGSAASLARLSTFLADNSVEKIPDGRDTLMPTVTSDDEERTADDNKYSSRGFSNSGGGRGRGGGRGGSSGRNR